MKIWVMSDIHDDFSRSAIGVWQPSVDVDADVLVVAGDIAGRLSTMGRDWVENQRRRLGIPIVIVAGNHACQTALEWDPGSAFKRGSDSSLVQFDDGNGDFHWGSLPCRAAFRSHPSFQPDSPSIIRSSRTAS